MAWNRPTSNTVDATSSSRPSGRGKMPRLRRGLIAGAIVVLGAGIAAWLLTNGEAASSPLQKKDRGLIKEVAPKLPPKSAAQLEKEAHPGMVKVRGKWYPKYNKKGGKIWVTKYDVRYHSPIVHTNRSNTTFTSREYKIFTNQADRDIAQMLTCPIGAVVIGDWNFDKRFVKDFLESLKTPIIVTKDDDEWAAELKRSVTETKIELKARYDAGEDIAKIMNETRKELQEQGVYKLQLEELVRKEVHEAKGDATASKDVYEAANKMLKEKGMAPMEMPSFLVRRLQMASKPQAPEQLSEESENKSSKFK